MRGVSLPEETRLPTPSDLHGPSVPETLVGCLRLTPFNLVFMGSRKRRADPVDSVQGDPLKIGISLF